MCALVLLLSGSLALSLPVFGSTLQPSNCSLFFEAQDTRQPDTREPSLGTSVEKALAAGQSHGYRFPLKAGQYFRLVVIQKGIDVVVTAFQPDGKKIMEIDSPNGTQGPEIVSLVASTTGDYWMEVKPLKKDAVPGRYEIMIETLREATAHDRDRVSAEASYREGEQLHRQGTAESLERAKEKYRAALTLWRSAGDRLGEAESLSQLGAVCDLLGLSMEALTHCTEALSLYRLMNDRRGEATSLNQIGVAYYKLGEVRKASEYLEEALRLRRAVPDRYLEAIPLINLGSVFLGLGEPAKALDCFDKALELIRIHKDRHRESLLLHNIGVIHYHANEPQKALDYFAKALPITQTLGNRSYEATILYSTGQAYALLGENGKALDYLKQALLLRRDLGDRSGEATTLNSLGAVEFSLGNRPAALELLQQALSLLRTLGDKKGTASALINLGSVYSSVSEPLKALDCFNESLALSRASGSRQTETDALSSVGAVYRELRDYPRALESLEQALKLSRKIGYRVPEPAILYHLAQVERARGRFDEARIHIESAINLIESSRAQVTSPELRTSLLASKQDFYEFYIGLLMHLHEKEPGAGHDWAALQASERERARGLLELLAEARIDVQQGIDPSLKAKERTVLARISAIQSQLINTHSQASPDKHRIEALEKELKMADEEREQVGVEIRQKHPRYAELHYPAPLGLKAIQQLLDEKTVILEYSLGKETSFLFATSKDGFLSARLPAASLISQKVTALREAIATRPNRAALSTYIQNAQSLYTDLIRPATSLLEGKQSLIIVPYGILYYLPFEVLLQPTRGGSQQVALSELPYLLRNHVISYVPSATVLANLRRHTRSSEPPRKRLLAFGDPVYEHRESEPVDTGLSAGRSAFGDAKPWDLRQLPESRFEVERIAALYPKEQVAVFLGKAATEENLKAADRLQQYQFVHFAVHGVLNESKPQYSSIILSLPREPREPSGHTTPRMERRSPEQARNAVPSPQTKSHQDDGLLQVYEIFNLRLNADLVALSACETGLGKEVRGEGLIGFTQAFLYAGTPSVLVSLWKVQDKSTSELMVRFYKHLNALGVNPASALRRAQVDMIGRSELAHPYYWAGFVIVGQP